MDSARFAAALEWATRRHAEQVRHNTRTPYVGHVLATCAIVLEEGGDEDAAIAALLHDVLEDAPTDRDELSARFGPEVRRLVEACTDAAYADRPGLVWRDRKLAHLDRMRTLDDRALLIIAADKAVSLQSLLDDFVRFGPDLLAGSARSGADLLWNYHQITDLLTARLGERPIARRLTGLVAELAERV